VSPDRGNKGACRRVTRLKECTGYQDKGRDTDDKVNRRSATYSVSVHEATTGKELGATELSGRGTQHCDCMRTHRTHTCRLCGHTTYTPPLGSA